MVKIDKEAHKRMVKKEKERTKAETTVRRLREVLEKIEEYNPETKIGKIEIRNIDEEFVLARIHSDGIINRSVKRK